MNCTLEIEFNTLIDIIKTYYKKNYVVDLKQKVEEDLTPKVLEELLEMELPYLEKSVIHRSKDKNKSYKHLEFFNVLEIYVKLEDEDEDEDNKGEILKDLVKQLVEKDDIEVEIKRLKSKFDYIKDYIYEIMVNDIEVGYFGELNNKHENIRVIAFGLERLLMVKMDADNISYFEKDKNFQEFMNDKGHRKKALHQDGRFKASQDSREQAKLRGGISSWMITRIR